MRFFMRYDFRLWLTRRETISAKHINYVNCINEPRKKCLKMIVFAHFSDFKDEYQPGLGSELEIRIRKPTRALWKELSKFKSIYCKSSSKRSTITKLYSKIWKCNDPVANNLSQLVRLEKLFFNKCMWILRK